MSGLAFNPAQAKSRGELLRELFPEGIREEDYNVLPMALQLIEDYQSLLPESRTYLIGGGDDFCALVKDILVNMERGRALKVTVHEEVV